MLRQSDLENYFQQRNFDLRLTRNGRWIDQKCTPDVVSVIADCVVEYVTENTRDIWFSKNDIWHSSYAEEYVRDIFNKPSTSKELSKNEYDKFFSQPLEMLASAGVLKKKKENRINYYKVSDFDLLEYISLREKNSLLFIILYCQKVLQDSGIWNCFENFFQKQDKESFQKMKTEYEDFIITNTPINGTTEARRIFTKVLNPLSNRLHKKGTNRGNLSKNAITYAELMYNRPNFRDINSIKPKEITRKEWAEQQPQQVNIQFYKYQSQKAKKYLRKFNDAFRAGKSEFNDEYAGGPAIHMHHIFPEHAYPEISMFLENLIAITPTQHMTKAHPLGKTKEINVEYQELLLKAKAGSIEENLGDVNVETIYSFERFLSVLNTGFDEENEIIDPDYSKVMNVINLHYMNLD